MTSEFNTPEQGHVDEQPTDESAYSLVELRRNRTWNVMVSVVTLIGLWGWHLVGSIDRRQAMVGTAVVLVLAVLYRLLFASSASVKINKDSAGLGKRVHPRTMGAILGFFYDGFKR